jgi:hypothetical protein
MRWNANVHQHMSTAYGIDAPPTEISAGNPDLLSGSDQAFSMIICGWGAQKRRARAIRSDTTAFPCVTIM